MAADDLEIGLLGPLRVRLGHRCVDIRSGRHRAVLATLAIEAGRPVSTQRLARAVWGEELPVNVRKSVQTHIMRLRRLLGAGRIRTEPAGYRLELRPDQVDAGRFAALLAAAAGQDQAAQRQLLAEALALWRGTPFEGVGSRWLDEIEAARITELYLSARERAVDLDLAAGRHDAAVADLREATARFPLREALWCRLLLALRLAGRHAEALACYGAVRSLLADELGADPGPELRRQHAELLAGGPVRAPSVAVPQQLPVAPGVFVGRAGETAELSRAAGEFTLIVLHGPGGVGKTALALHWAHRLRDRFPDGRLFINLHGYGPGRRIDPGSALRSLLIGLGVPEPRIPADLEARSSMLRTLLAGRRGLLVLDNALDVGHVRPLIPGSGWLALVTSRNQLHGLAVCEGAHRIAVGLLSAAESAALLRAKLRRPAADCLLDELAELCGRLPLALSIAAERCGDDVVALLADLGDRRLDALTVGDGTDLRAVLTRSYQVLDPYAARAFRLLGQHLGTRFGLSAAAAVLGSTSYDACVVLERLADQHLLLRTGARRFEFHRLVRAFAVELTRRDGEWLRGRMPAEPRNRSALVSQRK